MAFRVTFFLQQVVGTRTAGWSMNFWNTGTDSSVVQGAALSLATAINDFTGRGVRVTGARIQDLSSFRAATPVAYTFSGGTVTTGPTTADYPTTKGLLRIFGPGKYLVNQWIGTLQDGDTTRAGVYTPSPASVIAFNAIRNLLIVGTNGWNIYGQDKSIARVDVTAITAPGVVTAPGHGLLTGNKTRISRTKGLTGVNKIWLVTKIDNDTFQLNVPPAGGFVGALTEPGKSQKQSRIFQAITDAQIIRTTEHKVGRPFGLFSGRRKTRKT